MIFRIMLLSPVSKQLQAKCSFIQREAFLWQTVASRAFLLQVAMVSAHLMWVFFREKCFLWTDTGRLMGTAGSHSSISKRELVKVLT